MGETLQAQHVDAPKLPASSLLSEFKRLLAMGKE